NRLYVLKTTIVGVDNIANVNIVDKSNEAITDNIVSKKVVNSTIEVCSKSPLSKIEIGAQGYKTLTADVPSYDKLYVAEGNWMLINSENSSQLCITFNNNDNSRSIYINDCLYYDQEASDYLQINSGDNSSYKKTSYMVVNKNKNHNISVYKESSGGSVEPFEYTVTASELQKYDGYMTMNTSEINKTPNGNYGSFLWKIFNMNDVVGKIYSSYGYATIDKQSSGTNSGKDYDTCFVAERVKVGDTLNYKKGDSDDVFSYTLTEKDFELRALDISKFVKKDWKTLTPEVRFVGEDGKPIAEEILLLDKDNKTLMTSVNGKFVLTYEQCYSSQIDKLLHFKLPNGYTSKPYNDNGILFVNECAYPNFRLVVLAKHEDVKVKFSYGNKGEYLSKLRGREYNSGTQAFTDVYTYANNGYFSFNNLAEGDTIARFSKTPVENSHNEFYVEDGIRCTNLSVKFDRKLAKYNATEKCYYMDVQLQKEFIVEVTIANFGEIEKNIQYLFYPQYVNLECDGVPVYFYSETEHKNFLPVFKIVIYDSMVDKILEYSYEDFGSGNARIKGKERISADNIVSGKINISVKVSIYKK
ncbi:MAG: hypothetical protein RR348_02955, partial [Clostridia bacterium]